MSILYDEIDESGKKPYFKWYINIISSSDAIHWIYKEIIKAPDDCKRNKLNKLIKVGNTLKLNQHDVIGLYRT